MSEIVRGHALASPESRARTRRKRLIRVLSAIGALALVLVAAFYAGGAWYFTNSIYDQALNAPSVRAAFGSGGYPIQVVAAGDPITLRLPPDSGELVTPGTWGLTAADGGFGQIGTIVSKGAGSITRSFHQFAGPPIVAGENVRLAHTAFPEDPLRALGLPYGDVTYDGPLGRYPAWFIAGTSPDWAILVHGNSMHRVDMMRMLAPIHRAGLPALVITYRNDPGAPADPSGMLRYGATEWQDLEAAVEFALAQGAQHIWLAGVSMGGAIVVSFMYRSQLAGRVTALVLDSPMLDFAASIDHVASATQLPLVGLPVPGSLVAVTKQLASLRFGIDWQQLDYLAGDARLHVPILLFQGTADGTVPPTTSDRLAADRPDLVTYVVTPGAGHVDSWNIDPARYERYVESFFAAH